MQRSNRELWIAFFLLIAVSLVYLVGTAMLGGIPRASGLFGHSLGILGFVLMLMTETLYTIRKRSRKARWGRTSHWLDFHIITGIVGPFMVLLHSSWKFHGLAGLVTLLTVVIVTSGFIGRYIYTSVPRTADGVEMERNYLEGRILAAEREIQAWLQASPQAMQALPRAALPAAAISGEVSMPAPNAGSLNWRKTSSWRKARRKNPELARQMDQLNRLVRQRDLLRRQVAALARARRLLALWHAVHIPVGLALFTAAFIHIGAAIYYATLLR